MRAPVQPSGSKHDPLNAVIANYFQQVELLNMPTCVSRVHRIILY
jgi:hypothetical protein